MAPFPRQGDIYWLDFDPALGSEIQKRRPSLVLSDERANRLGHILVVPITTKGQFARTAGFTVELPDTLKTKGVANIMQMRSVFFERRNPAYIETAPAATVIAVLEKLAAWTNMKV